MKIINYSLFFYNRYSEEYVIQLAVIAGEMKTEDLDSFLAPIISELKDLSEHGMVVKKNNREVICRCEVHLMLATGDMPAVAKMAHVSTHAGKYGCRICEVQGQKPDNSSSGMYFVEKDAPLRPKEDFLTGNIVS